MRMQKPVSLLRQALSSALPVVGETAAPSPPKKQARNSLLFSLLRTIYCRIRVPHALRGAFNSVAVFMRRSVPPKGIPVISILLCEHCNLNCASCFAFSPLAQNVFLSVDSFEKDMRRLAELTGENTPLEAVCFMGGEPLLHPEITAILDIARKYFSNTHFWVLTNGILLNKMPDSFWENCRKNNVEISCSDYPVKLPAAELKEKARRTGVSLIIPAVEENQQVPGLAWNKKTYDLNGAQNINRSFARCSASACFTLHNGKFYHCAEAPMSVHFNRAFGQNLEIKKEDYIDIHAIRDIQELLDFRYRPVPFCRYCRTNDVKPIDWRISKKTLDEWI